jgi:chromosome partitioning protein
MSSNFRVAPILTQQSFVSAKSELPTTQPDASGLKPRIVAVANQKGGVGKTTTALNLASVLAAECRVVLIDLDPQGNATTGLGLSVTSRLRGSYAVLSGDQALGQVLQPTAVPQLMMVPADADLAGAEVELAEEERREKQLMDAFTASSSGLASFDYVFIDCPPSLGLLTLNALVAADDVLVPLQCEFFALQGVSQIVRTVERVRHNLNPRLLLEGIVLTMHDRRNNLSEAVAADARAFFKDKVYDTVIPRNVRISEAPSHGLPVMLYDFKSPGAQAYIRLGAEFIRRRRAIPAANVQ